MKNELGEKIMINFVGIKSKTYSYLINDGSKEKKGKGQKITPLKEHLNLKIIKTIQN